MEAKVQRKGIETCKTAISTEQSLQGPGSEVTFGYSCTVLSSKFIRNRICLGNRRQCSYLKGRGDKKSRQLWPSMKLLYHHPPKPSIIHFLSTKNTLPRSSKVSFSHCIRLKVEDNTIFVRFRGGSPSFRDSGVLINTQQLTLGENKPDLYHCLSLRCKYSCHSPFQDTESDVEKQKSMPYCLESFHGLETRELKRQVIAPLTLQTYIDDIK